MEHRSDGYNLGSIKRWVCKDSKATCKVDKIMREDNDALDTYVPCLRTLLQKVGCHDLPESVTIKFSDGHVVWSFNILSYDCSLSVNPTTLKLRFAKGSNDVVEFYAHKDDGIPVATDIGGVHQVGGCIRGVHQGGASPYDAESYAELLGI
jgi:hypothetical protein